MKHKALPLVRNNPRHQRMLGITQLESTLAQKDLGVLLDKQIEHEPPMCPHSKEGKWYSGLH